MRARVHCDDLLGEFVVHGRLPGFGDDEQGFVIFTEEPVPFSPGQVEIGELREPLAVAHRHFHKAQRIGDEVIRSEGGKRRDQFGGGATNGLMNLLGIEPSFEIFGLLGQDERRKVPGKEPHHVQQFLFLQSASRLLEQPAGHHVGGKTVGHFLHLAGRVRSSLRGLDQHEELIPVSQLFADLARSSPLRVAFAEQVSQVGAGAQVVDV